MRACDVAGVSSAYRRQEEIDTDALDVNLSRGAPSLERARSHGPEDPWITRGVPVEYPLEYPLEYLLEDPWIPRRVPVEDPLEYPLEDPWIPGEYPSSTPCAPVIC